MSRSLAVRDFLSKLPSWAVAQEGILAVGLVGSHARSSAALESDVDVVIVADRPDELLENPEWVEAFGTADRMQVETYGKVTSLRVWYVGGLEVEFGLTDESWVSLPLDSGTRQVVVDGLIVLFERRPSLSRMSPPADTR